MARPGIIILKQGREKPLKQRHPWVFSGAIDKTRTNLDGTQPGDVLEIRGADGGFLGRGYYNPQSQIFARVLSWDQTEPVGPAWWRIRLARALAAREVIGLQDTNAYRLVHAENDALPGLVVDRYGDNLVVQALTLGIEVAKDTIVDALAKVLKPAGIFERSDSDARHKEGLPDSVGLLWGEAPPQPLIITEHGVQYPVDIANGHKTGFYLDQRDARAWVLSHPSINDAEVLNAFSYTGSFAACAALNGAKSVTNIDSSEPSLELARETLALNGLDNFDAEYVAADVFQQLRVYREEERFFDVIILDPPKFAHSAKQVERASRGYKDINMLAFEILRPGGMLLTFSCSGQVSPDLFQKIVFGASVDAGVQAQIIGRFNQPADHPVLLDFPEGQYLKGLACRISEF